ncbi:hypothetical protein VSX64_11500 [Aurantimonas sp. C2-6-R+9]|uniref:hypothetical protein n=1 Tax=unclassified Aurantimonas TaxID=2638230 RepID=UPI002E17D63F|nr:hypothetical protein [Aurantimonas sp. C2-3-R2]MEC5381502.1 hypothetical protein [Aurantimonas sp. C2-6-R+9]MEC5411863.1 hypothetical protein [Aurantimonas sp. C2-4-R8]
MEVVEQDAHANAAPGGFDHVTRHQMSGQVAVPGVVLKIDRVGRSFHERKPRGEGLGSVREKVVSAVTRVARVVWSERLDQVSQR